MNKIVYVIEMKRQIDLAKVVMSDGQIRFSAKAAIPEGLKQAYYAEVAVENGAGQFGNES